MQANAVRPLQLISFDRHARQFTVHEEAARALRAIDKPLAVVVAAGRSRIGKSTLLNRLVGAQPGQGFAAAGTARAVTDGIWLWPRPLVEEPDRVVVVLDTEGLDDCGKGMAIEENYDDALFSLAMLLSSTLLFNAKGNLDVPTLEKLAKVAICAKNIYKESDEGGTTAENSVMPGLLLLVRDWELDAGNNSALAWLEEALECEEDEDGLFKRKGSSSSSLKGDVKAYFKRRDAVFMPYPLKMHSEEAVQRLEQQPRSSFTEGFEESVLTVRSRIEMSDLKVLCGLPVNGNRLVELANHYVKSINDGNCPRIGSAVRAVEASICKRALDAANAAFDAGREHAKSIQFKKLADANSVEMQYTQLYLELYKEARAIFDAQTVGVSGGPASEFAEALEARCNQLKDMTIAELKHRILSLTLQEQVEMNAEDRKRMEEERKLLEGRMSEMEVKFQEDFKQQGAKLEAKAKKEAEQLQAEAIQRERKLKEDLRAQGIAFQKKIQESKRENDKQLTKLQQEKTADKAENEKRLAELRTAQRKQAEDFARQNIEQQENLKRQAFEEKQRFEAELQSRDERHRKERENEIKRSQAETERLEQNMRHQMQQLEHQALMHSQQAERREEFMMKQMKQVEQQAAQREEASARHMQQLQQQHMQAMAARPREVEVRIVERESACVVS